MGRSYFFQKKTYRFILEGAWVIVGALLKG